MKRKCKRMVVNKWYFFSERFFFLIKIKPRSDFFLIERYNFTKIKISDKVFFFSTSTQKNYQNSITVFQNEGCCFYILGFTFKQKKSESNTLRNFVD